MVWHIFRSVPYADVHHKAIRFYMEQHPSLTAALLTAQADHVDPTRVIAIACELDRTILIMKYLQVCRSVAVSDCSSFAGEMESALTCFLFPQNDIFGN